MSPARSILQRRFSFVESRKLTNVAAGVSEVGIFVDNGSVTKEFAPLGLIGTTECLIIVYSACRCHIFAYFSSYHVYFQSFISDFPTGVTFRQLSLN